MRFVARFFFVVFTIVVINMLINGGYKSTTMGSERFVSAASNPLKYYFALVWQSLIICVSFYFGFIVKLGTNNGEKNS
ncbi:hypothetical protein GCM10007978_45090 [Shewanella hanedai]|nr:hypothetical protein GCM10007978_45090 [Shewanella hanedai]